MMDNCWTRGQFEITALIGWFQSGDQNGSRVENKLVRDWTRGQFEITAFIGWFQSGDQNGSRVENKLVRDWTFHFDLIPVWGLYK